MSTTSTSARDGRVVPLTVGELPALDVREVVRCNASLAHLARQVFAVGGVPVQFRWAPMTDPDLPAGHDTWLWLDWSGMPLLVAASPALSNAVSLALADVSVDQLGEPGLDVLGQLMLAPRLPAGLSLHQAAPSRSALLGVPQGLEPLGVWQGWHGTSGEPSGHRLALWAEPAFPLAALLTAMASLATSRRPSPLASMPIALPLVAARWQVDAGQLHDLAVGDVLMLG